MKYNIISMSYRWRKDNHLISRDIKYDASLNSALPHWLDSLISLISSKQLYRQANGFPEHFSSTVRTVS